MLRPYARWTATPCMFMVASTAPTMSPKKPTATYSSVRVSANPIADAHRRTRQARHAQHRGATGARGEDSGQHTADTGHERNRASTTVSSSFAEAEQVLQHRDLRQHGGEHKSLDNEGTGGAEPGPPVAAR